MDKMKKSAGIKLAAAIVLAVTLFGMIASGILAIYFTYSGVYEPGGKQQYERRIIENAIIDYNNTAISAYSEIYFSDCDYSGGLKEYYDDYFSEENTNYFYKIEPIDDDSDKYPTVSSYYTDDYSYSKTDDFSLVKDSKEYTFVYELPENLIKKLQKYQPYYYESEYSTEDYGDVEEKKQVDSKYEKEINEKFDRYNKKLEDSNIDNFIIYLGETTYNLGEDFEFREAFVKFLESQDIEKFDKWDAVETRYDDYGVYEFRMVISAYTVSNFRITGYVKSDLTASDAFTGFFALGGIAKLVDYVWIILVVTFVLSLLLAAFLVGAAGHHEGSDEIKENVLDRIPYDIVLGIYQLIAIFSCDYFNNHIYYEGLIILGGFVLILPYLLITTATRIKVGSLFKNTVIYRAILLLVKAAKKACEIIKYFYSSLNVYIKYIGLFVAFSLVEFVLVCAAEDISFMGFLWFFEKIIIIGILAVALINMDKLRKGAKEMAEGNLTQKVDTEKMLSSFKEHGDNLNRIQDGIAIAVDERLKSERLKTELITNVSHDIKTPLTSIISYVDLLEKENVEGEKAKEYIEVLDRQSAKLKKLIQDLIDASKASTGNMPVNMEKLELKVLVDQMIGEYEEKFENRNLRVNAKYCVDDISVMADGKLLWRTFDNIFVNIYKYAQENTRIYIDVDCENEIEEGDCIDIVKTVRISFKNISKDELNITGDELMERFVRGDSSRNTEGSGLGLSIAKSLVELQGGKMEIVVDGDLFKVVLSLMRA